MISEPSSEVSVGLLWIDFIQYTSSLHQINLSKVGQEWVCARTAICIAWPEDFWLVWAGLAFDVLRCWSTPL